MEKKQLKKKSTKPWQCSECKDADKVMCKHLQKLMPKQYGSSVSAFSIPDSQKFPNPLPKISKGERGMMLRKKLSTYAKLSPIMIDILVYKLAYKWSYADIAKHYKWTNRSSVVHVYNMAKEALIEAGVKI